MLSPHRLPRSVIPRRYDLLLVPDLDAASFQGEVTITLDVREPVSEVRLNAAELTIARAAFLGDGAETKRPSLSNKRPSVADFPSLALCPSAKANSPSRSKARSTTNSAASIAVSSGTNPAGNAGSPPRSSRPPTLAGPSPASTSPTSRPSSPSLSSSTRLSKRSATPPSCEDKRRARQTRSHLRRHHPDVHLPASPSSSARWRRRSRAMVGTPRARLVRPREAAPYGLRPRRRGAVAGFLRGVLRPPVSGRQARPDRHPGLRGGRDGELRRHHLPRDGPAGGRGDRHPRRSASASPTWSRTRTLTCGSATSSRWGGGTGCG